MSELPPEGKKLAEPVQLQLTSGNGIHLFIQGSHVCCLPSGNGKDSLTYESEFTLLGCALKDTPDQPRSIEPSE
eukprot:4588793-Amphidinium_carterae.1